MSGHDAAEDAQAHDTALMEQQTAEDHDSETGELAWDGFRDGRIQNFLGLDWAGKKLAEYKRAIEQNCTAEREEAARLRARVEALNAPLAKHAAFFQSVIEAYARDHKAEILVGRAKSRALPSGLKLAWRAKPAGCEVKDVGALHAWAGLSGFSEQIFPEPPPRTVADMLSKSGLNKVMKTVKSEVPGVERIPESETLSIDVEEK